MYSYNTILLAIIVALLAGAALGALLGRRMSPDSKKQREMQRNLDELLLQQKDYKHEVAEHFTDTAKLLGNLAESYRDVHNHLANGAIKLADGHPLADLQPIADNAIEHQAEDKDQPKLQQPLDYAPKSSPHQTGMLNEEFGLDKVEADVDVEAEAESKVEPAPKEPATERV